MSRVITGDAFDVLADMDAESVHAVVTDPPYGLAFMGRDWDDFEPKEYQAWCEGWATLCLDVLKPGGHLLAFSGNRTHHRLFSGVEDAGFEVRDTLTWHYGSGFPKALDVSKAIDKAEGEEGNYGDPKSEAHAGWIRRGRMRGDGSNNHDGWQSEWMKDEDQVDKNARKYLPATDAAREWDGFKTALKPATEFIVLARKPFSGTVAENVQRHGTGALNVGECRIQGVGGSGNWSSVTEKDGDVFTSETSGFTDTVDEPHESGRYPANVIFDAEAAAQLDREVGELSSGEIKGEYQGSRDDDPIYGEYGVDFKNYDANTGVPSRYFYTSKATRAERTLDGKIDNAHPTVKPVDLMEWLVRLVTAEGQNVLDPFAGTGTTGRAAKNLGREFIGIEKQATWADVARARCGLTPEDPGRLAPEGQTTLTD